MFVGGEWRPSRTGATFAATSPATGETIGSVAEGDRDDARAAIAAARAAAERWAGLTAFERAAKLHAVGDVIESRREELADTLTLDQGKPLRAEAFDEVDELVEYWRGGGRGRQAPRRRAAELVLAGQAGAAGAAAARRGRA